MVFLQRRRWENIAVRLQVLAAMICCACGCAVHESAPTPLRMFCRAESTSQKSSPVLRLFVVNPTSQLVIYPCMNTDDRDYLIKVYRNGWRVSPTEEGSRRLTDEDMNLERPLENYGSEAALPIPPGSRREFVVELGRLFSFSEPGNYLIDVHRRFCDDTGTGLVILATRCVYRVN